MGLSAAARRVGDATAGKVEPWAVKYGLIMEDRQVLTGRGCFERVRLDTGLVTSCTGALADDRMRSICRW